MKTVVKIEGRLSPGGPAGMVRSGTGGERAGEGRGRGLLAGAALLRPVPVDPARARHSSPTGRCQKAPNRSAASSRRKVSRAIRRMRPLMARDGQDM
ncbi:hypothetical protein Ppa06_00180 [Planomonospora parontospora subsp. parontospora]|uniref:Uncharacterized protein n=2 Tax=Planomonospora parontospora TaxID=58119 RepID=A0AA37BAS2_9ACTN|nr:hypothetical protein GCM10010126_00180 [Planomonospora parontospora]GII06220.1 hypothetical protein Ppa06_00180 [Planomonospora parontospora subsp. parontospora]